MVTGNANALEVPLLQHIDLRMCGRSSFPLQSCSGKLLFLHHSFGRWSRALSGLSWIRALALISYGCKNLLTRLRLPRDRLGKLHHVVKNPCPQLRALGIKVFGQLLEPRLFVIARVLKEILTVTIHRPPHIIQLHPNGNAIDDFEGPHDGIGAALRDSKLSSLVALIAPDLPPLLMVKDLVDPLGPNEQSLIWERGCWTTTAGHRTR